MTPLAAILASLAGVALLRLAWRLGRRNGGAGRVGVDLAAWAVLAGSIPLWVAAGGPDRGVALAGLAFMLPGVALVGLAAWQSLGARQRRRPDRVDEVRNAREQVRYRHRWARRLLVFVLAGPLAAAAAVLLAIGLNAALTSAGWAPANVMAAVLLFVPLAWAALAIAATTHYALWKRSGVVLSAAIAGLACWPLAQGIAG